MPSVSLPAVLTAVVAALLAAPYLAGLSRTVPDRENTRWWRGERASVRLMLLTGAIAVLLACLAALGTGWSACLPVYLGAALLLTPLVVIDAQTKRLPNRLVFLTWGWVAVGLALVSLQQGQWWPLGRALICGAVVSGVFFAVVLAAPRSFGLGDVKLLAVLCAMTGWFGWLSAYYGLLGGFVIGAAVGIGQMVAGRATRKSQIPFGPSLILGTFLILALYVPN